MELCRPVKRCWMPQKNLRDVGLSALTSSKPDVTVPAHAFRAFPVPELCRPLVSVARDAVQSRLGGFSARAAEHCRDHPRLERSHRVSLKAACSCNTASEFIPKPAYIFA